MADYFSQWLDFDWRPSKRPTLSNWSMHRPAAGLITFLFLVRFLDGKADQGSVIGRDGRRGLCGPKAPRPRSAVLLPRGYLWRVGNKNKYEINLPTDNRLYQMVIMCMADTRRYGPICTYIRNLYWVSNSEIEFSVNEMPARVNAWVYRERW